jgi:hypothetical protein
MKICYAAISYYNNEIYEMAIFDTEEEAKAMCKYFMLHDGYKDRDDYEDRGFENPDEISAYEVVQAYYPNDSNLLLAMRVASEL